MVVAERDLIKKNRTLPQAESRSRPSIRELVSEVTAGSIAWLAVFNQIGSLRWNVKPATERLQLTLLLEESKWMASPTIPTSPLQLPLSVAEMRLANALDAYQEISQRLKPILASPVQDWLHKQIGRRMLPF